MRDSRRDADRTPARLVSGSRIVRRRRIQILDTATGKGRLVARLPFNVAFRAGWVDNDTAVIVNRQDTVSHIVLFDRFWSTEPAQ